MNIHEYQGKAVLKEFGLPVSRGKAIFSADEAEAAAKELGELGTRGFCKNPVGVSHRVLHQFELALEVMMNDAFGAARVPGDLLHRQTIESVFACHLESRLLQFTPAEPRCRRARRTSAR